MKKVQKALTLIVMCATILTMSSCNRGVGCPNNFSINDVINVVVAVFTF